MIEEMKPKWHGLHNVVMAPPDQKYMYMKQKHADVYKPLMK